MFKAHPLIINDLQSYAFLKKLKMPPLSLKMHPGIFTRYSLTFVSSQVVDSVII